MQLQSTDQNNGEEYIGISRRAPFMATYQDEGGILHRASFSDAPNWQYWDKLDVHHQSIIINHISH